jgi:ribosomal protein S18 acetylase RimI-like enzyme
MTLEIVELNEEIEARFLEHVHADPLEYYFYILDWEFNRADSKFLLALEGKDIRGIMLTYKTHVAQFRGSREAVEELFPQLSLEKTDIIVPLGMGDIPLKSYEPSEEGELILMHLNKGDEKLSKTHETVEASVDDADAMAKMMREALPSFWGDETGEKIRVSMEKTFWLISKDGDEIAALGNVFFADFGSNIGVICTHKDYRNKGYATTITSSLVEEIFQRQDKALIHVFADNLPAVRAYSKVGFKPFNRYVLIKGERK